MEGKSSHEHCYSGHERVEEGKAPLACRRNLEVERGVVILDTEGMQRPVRLSELGSEERKQVRMALTE